MEIQGQYYYPASSKSEMRIAHLDDSHIKLFDLRGELKFEQTITQVVLSTNLPGLAAELSFSDRGRFVPDDVQFRWPFATKRQGLAERLEKNKLLILCAVLFTPIIIWLLLYKAVPNIAAYSVDIMPKSMVERMGEQSLYVIENVALEPTEIAVQQQAKLQLHWSQMLDALRLDADSYRLSIYKSDYLGANAFALPHGRVVVTDELITLLKDKPRALQAIMLHEIGHVQHQHGIRMVAQSASTAIVLAVIFADLEGVAEIVLGSGSTFLQQAFSRDMERQADHFAIAQLEQLGYSSHDFADAIEALQQSVEGVPSETGSTWLKYLSTHPSSQERIEQARNYSDK